MGKNTIKSDVTLFRIVDGIRELGGAGVTELADHTGMTKGTVHKHLATLEELGLVESEDSDYQLGIEFLKYGGYVRYNSNLSRLAQPKVKELASNIGEQIAFSLKNRDKAIFVFRENYQYGLQEEIKVGESTFLHQNAAGKAILSQLSDENIERIIDRTGLPEATENTITDSEELHRDIAETRERGYSINVEERHEGICAIATAVHDEDDDELGAISIAGPAHRFKRDELVNRYADVLLETRDEIAVEVKYG